MRKLKIISLDIIFACFFVCFFVFSSVIVVSAGSLKKELVNDSISANSIGENWQVKEDSKITYKTSGGAFLRLSGYQSSDGLNVNAIYTSDSVEFAQDEDLMVEYDVLNHQGDRVFLSIMQGIELKDDIPWAYNYAYDKTFGYYVDTKIFTVKEPSKLAFEQKKDSVWQVMDPFDFSEKYRVRHIFRSEATEDQSAIEVYLTPIKADGTFNFQSENTIELRMTANRLNQAMPEYVIGDGNVGINIEDLNNAGGYFDFDNLKISKISSTGTEEKSVILETSFEDGKVPAGLTTCAPDSKRSVGILSVSELLFDQTTKADLLFSKEKFEVDSKAEGVIGEFDFSLGINDNSSSAEIGILLGADAVQFDENGIIAGISLNDDENKLIIKQSGKMLCEKVIETLNIEDFEKLNIKIKKEGEKTELVVKYKEVVLTAEINVKDVAGYFAIGNFSTQGYSFKVDDIVVNEFEYMEYPSKNIIADFENGVPNNEEWWFSSVGAKQLSNDLVPDPENDARDLSDTGVKFDGGVLKFDRVSDGTYFGPKMPYGDWELSFDFLDYQYEATFREENGLKLWTPASLWAGFSFHKGNYNEHYAGESVYNLFFSRRETNNENQSELVISGWNASKTFTDTTVVNINGTVDAPISVSIKAINRTVTVSVKLLSEEEFKVVKTITDIDTEGYLGFCATNWTTFTVDNVSVKNLDKYYDPANYPLVEIIGKTTMSFDKSKPEDVVFGLDSGLYNYRVIGSMISIRIQKL